MENIRALGIGIGLILIVLGLFIFYYVFFGLAMIILSLFLGKVLSMGYQQYREVEEENNNALREIKTKINKRKKQ